MRDRLPCTYILASAPRGTLYTGVTSNLLQRIWQHSNDQTRGFTSQHRVHHLVWFETHDTMDAAITREKRLKAWQRLRKIQLVESTNPEWHDLYPQLI
ncbi:GIY-YIG nuclease family protein [Luteimonas fraxinea]|uniref:GIY-YIG nuclease family protein n=1 Tax=Luteimonas fraxinea TaxID=2901869 RepID=A0ABS8U9W2_9GAMM|nr:GIY-YIG nuclease family protein [Luteimonas fraxinea]MCD9096268.1 GIY-YIG nuclease family protein [Luteimonas fraxinea]MCD9125611.1 GIY-YIG nuclease family protein [Luteimonas fraxinea]UHH10354.1 GIY-YIG nuclease family protein [Luteimonas fraxinea]